RGGSGSAAALRGQQSAGGAAGVIPGERFATPPANGRPGRLDDPPFVSGEIADRGPLERGAPVVPDTRAREARELDRQKAWRDQASRALTALKAEEGTAPVNADELDDDDDDDDSLLPIGIEEAENGDA